MPLCRSPSRGTGCMLSRRFRAVGMNGYVASAPLGRCLCRTPQSAGSVVPRFSRSRLRESCPRVGFAPTFRPGYESRGFGRVLLVTLSRAGCAELCCPSSALVETNSRTFAPVRHELSAAQQAGLNRVAWGSLLMKKGCCRLPCCHRSARLMNHSASTYPCQRNSHDAARQA